MRKKIFNKKARRRTKINIKRNADRKKLFSKRIGGMIGISVLLENRNINAADLSSVEKEVM